MVRSTSGCAFPARPAPPVTRALDPSPCRRRFRPPDPLRSGLFSTWPRVCPSARIELLSSSPSPPPRQPHLVDSSNQLAKSRGLCTFPEPGPPLWPPLVSQSHRETFLLVKVSCLSGLPWVLVPPRGLTDLTLPSLASGLAGQAALHLTHVQGEAARSAVCFGGDLKNDHYCRVRFGKAWEVQAGRAQLVGIEAAAEMGGRKDRCGLGRKGAGTSRGPAECQVL